MLFIPLLVLLPLLNRISDSDSEVEAFGKASFEEFIPAFRGTIL